MNGIELITLERERQIVGEHWSAYHDDHINDDNQLACAASYYALPDESRPHNHVGWPWSPSSWKPSPDNRIRELVKAGALIVAEIERLQRLESK